MRGSLSRGVSVHEGVSVQGGSVQGEGLCPEGRVSIQGGLCPGGLCQGHPLYGNEQAVCILLECILVCNEFGYEKYPLTTSIFFFFVVIEISIAENTL